MSAKFSSLKTAIVHDSLLEYGGAERVLQTLFKLFPNADLYTLAARYSIFTDFFPNLNRKKIHILLSDKFYRSGSVLQCLALVMWRRLDLDQYDLVISNSSYLMSNTVNIRRSYHFLYINNIPKNLFGLSPKNKLQKYFDYSFLIKNRYITALKSIPYVVSNSNYTKEILHRKFGVNSDVISPPVYIPKFKKNNRKKYFLSVSRLNKIKNVEKIILACNKLKLSLKVVGSGIDIRYINFLKSIAGPTIEFLGFKTDSQLKLLYCSAKGLICASVSEDFGISAVEAQSYCIPVIAYYGGGFKETIIPDKTGIFYYNDSVNSLVQALRRFQKIRFDSYTIYKNAFKFRETRFLSEIEKYINNVIGTYEM